MDNRSQILAQALALFSERGYDAVGVQDIALAAGVTKPTLYHYFGSKRGLLDAVLAEHFGRLDALVVPAANYSGDLPLALTRIVQAMFRFSRQEPQFYRMYLSIWFAPPTNEAHAAVLPFLEQLNALLEELFRAATSDHGNMQGRQRAYAATFLGMINTYVALALSGQITLNDQIAQQAVQQFSYGIYS